ncbi:hypothetical protein HJD18_13045 [Thermoleophilia bacterium SCSIO 60948]|nr:hypothetical protein HJD18_13045 [Thermoleophilia bacterium SCSIO 60948]
MTGQSNTSSNGGAPERDADERHVVIVGGGASGTLVAAQLLRRHRAGRLLVSVVEPRGVLGPGLAYSTGDDRHRLNVPAADMGALPRDPGHFVRWANSRGAAIGPTDFAPRRLFGQYLTDLLAESVVRAGPGARLEHVVGRVGAIDLDRSDPYGRVELTIGEHRTSADRVVLALGNLAPPGLPGASGELAEDERYEHDAWSPDLPGRAAGDRTVLLLGTGLTMVDLALTLSTVEPAPQLLAVSRSGLLPRVHRRGVEKRDGGLGRLADDPELERVVDEINADAERTVADGGDWRTVVDSLRPLTNQIWRRFSSEDQRRFVDGLSRVWDVHRHRMAPEVGAALDELLEAGRLRLERSAVEAIRPAAGGLEVDLVADGEERTITVDRVVNCTGPALVLGSVGEPVIDSLFDRGIATPGPLRLGLDHDSRGALIADDARPLERIYAIGPMRKGRLWETTAVPEIREQALEIADRITSDLASRRAVGVHAPR